MVVNCECLQRLYLGGNRLTGTVPRYLRHVRDLRELNIERNNLHGEVSAGVSLSFGSNFRDRLSSSSLCSADISGGTVEEGEVRK